MKTNDLKDGRQPDRCEVCDVNGLDGTTGALDDYRRDENGLDMMESACDCDDFEGHPI